MLIVFVVTLLMILVHEGAHALVTLALGGCGEGVKFQ